MVYDDDAELAAQDVRIQQALVTLETIKHGISAAEHAALATQLYNDELAVISSARPPPTSLEALSRAASASRLREQQATHQRASMLEAALSTAQQHPYYAPSLVPPDRESMRPHEH